MAASLDLIVEMRFGAHLYGTDTPESDLDVKGVYLPDGRDILLQRVSPTMTLGPAKAAGERNHAGDVDREYFSLQRYLELLAAGQTMAIDMLFAPDAAMLRPSAPLWRDIQAQAPRLVSRRATAFLRYCRQQANKYGIKGSRVATARQALAMLAEAEAGHGTAARLAILAPELERFAAATEHAGLIDAPMPGDRIVRHLEVCGRRMPYTASVKSAREVLQRLVDDYGQRALEAERHQGVDWKALSHAVRVGREAIELFKTGRIDFPLACADHLRRIKRGDIPYAAVAEEIEDLLAAVEAAAAASILPEAPDQAVLDDLVERAHRAKVLTS